MASGPHGVASEESDPVAVTEKGGDDPVSSTGREEARCQSLPILYAPRCHACHNPKFASAALEALSAIQANLIQIVRCDNRSYVYSRNVVCETPTPNG